MPNTPIAVGAGCTGTPIQIKYFCLIGIPLCFVMSLCSIPCVVLCHNANADPTVIEIVIKLMSAGGTCEVIGESLFASVSAVSGSGPAYVSILSFQSFNLHLINKIHLRS
jgi:pyrroline-5-carboxylate reductase